MKLQQSFTDTFEECSSRELDQLRNVTRRRINETMAQLKSEQDRMNQIEMEIARRARH